MASASRSVWVLYRDFLFLILATFALKLVFLVESNPGQTSSLLARFLHGSTSIPFSYIANSLPAAEPGGLVPGAIVDSGFQFTGPLHRFLERSPVWNDVLAALNSLGLLAVLWYPLKATFWDGDHTLSFRLINTQLFRAFCASFTFLPPSGEFLPSFFDFPEALHCLSGVDCSSSPLLLALKSSPVDIIMEAQRPPVLPFVTFFSGHVAMTVIIANHMYLRK
jgi:hypothetical protein